MIKTHWDPLSDSRGKQVNPFLLVSPPGRHCHLDWGQGLTLSMLVPLIVLLSPGWEVTNFGTSQFSPTGIHRYPQYGGGGVLTPSRPCHTAQREHIYSLRSEIGGINPNLNTLSTSTGFYCSPMAGVLLSLSLPHLGALSLL